MVIARILAIALALAPYTPRQDVAARAVAAIEFSDTAADALALIVIDLHETTLGRRGVPYGTCSAFCRSRCAGCSAPDARAAAEVAARVWRRSGEQCGVSRLRERFGFYHSGSCRRDAFADREAAAHRAVVRDYNASAGQWR